MAQEGMTRPKITLVMVQSVDARTTRGAEVEIYAWTSAEDSQLFFELIAKQRVIVMGRKTYEAAKAKITLRPNCLRLVMTREPARYADQVFPGQLEFSAESPAVLVERLTSLGYSEMLLVGGAEMNTAFLNAGLVDELWVTLEPAIFGMGRGLTAGLGITHKLDLKSLQQLNHQGTLHLRYKVK